MNIRIALSIALCIAALPALAVTTTPVIQARTVYLDQPGALDAIERENPAEYRRITEIIALAETMPCESDALLRMLKARYDARGSCGLQIFTSYPAKRRFSFALGNTFYEAIVTMRDSGGTLVPAATK
jgi:hypothetical protein